MNHEILVQKAKMGNTEAFTELMKLQMQNMYRTAKVIENVIRKRLIIN